MFIANLRPREVLRLFWAEQIVIEEKAKFLEPVYFWEVDQEGFQNG